MDELFFELLQVVAQFVVGILFDLNASTSKVNDDDFIHDNWVWLFD
jgi:hypothetical protein